MPKPRARIFTWDHRQQPDLEEMAALISELSGGKVVLQEVDTGSDEYAWTVADRELSEEERQRMYEVSIGG